MVVYRIVAASVVLLSLIGCQTTSGESYRFNPAVTPQSSGFMAVGQRVVAPLGYLVFCRESPTECAPASRLNAMAPASAEGASGVAAPPPTSLVVMSAKPAVRRTSADWKLDGEIVPAPRPHRLTIGQVQADAVPVAKLDLGLLAARAGPETETVDQNSSTVGATARVRSVESPKLLTATRWHELTSINSQVNDQVRAVRDDVLYQRAEWWSYPTDNAGDCEDYVLMKRKLLIAKGWPASSLLITVAKQWNGEGHAVLVVVTSQGEFVLDNMQSEVVSWRDAPYQWVSRQSRADPNKWVNLDPARMIGQSSIMQAAAMESPGNSS